MDFRAKPQRTAEPTQEDLRAMESLERRVLLSVNGRRSLGEIASRQGIIDDAQVEQVVEGLQRKGWIRLT